MPYKLFLFDADDTLFDFSSCERAAFTNTLAQFGQTLSLDDLFQSYRQFSAALWREVEEGKTSKEVLKSERFRRTFAKHGLDLPADDVGEAYLETLPETCVLVDHALPLCQNLRARGASVGIITNGFERVQSRRLQKSAIAPFIDFMVVSEQCGYAKPDVRFFEYTAGLVADFKKSETLVVGDRLETDIEGAHRFGLDACWFNPCGHVATSIKPKYEVSNLSQLLDILS